MIKKPMPRKENKQKPKPVKVKKVKQFKKVVGLWDIHLQDSINLNPIWDFISDFAPDELILGGDVSNFDCVSSYLADMSRALDAGILKDEYKDIEQYVLNPLIRALPPTSNITWLEGNHEERTARACAVNPQGRGYWMPQDNLDFKKYRITYLPYNKPYSISPYLVAIHGYSTVKFHAAKMVADWHKSIVYSHTHSTQVHTAVSPVDITQVMKGISVGCLSSRSPDYMKRRPSAWNHAFWLCYVDKDTGYFNDFIVNVIENTFIWNDKFYQ